jgi:hypothetical protein
VFWSVVVDEKGCTNVVWVVWRDSEASFEMVDQWDSNAMTVNVPLFDCNVVKRMSFLWQQDFVFLKRARSRGGISTGQWLSIWWSCVLVQVCLWIEQVACLHVDFIWFLVHVWMNGGMRVDYLYMRKRFHSIQVDRSLGNGSRQWKCLYSVEKRIGMHKAWRLTFRCMTRICLFCVFVWFGFLLRDWRNEQDAESIKAFICALDKSAKGCTKLLMNKIEFVWLVLIWYGIEWMMEWIGWWMNPSFESIHSFLFISYSYSYHIHITSIQSKWESTKSLRLRTKATKRPSFDEWIFVKEFLVGNLTVIRDGD